MKQRTNLQQPRINKILKTLEERLLVKSVKSVQNASRKVGRVGMWCGWDGGGLALRWEAGLLGGASAPAGWVAARPASSTATHPPTSQTPNPKPTQVFMLYELEPAKELTGGPWYGPDAFDSEFISVLQEVRAH